MKLTKSLAKMWQIDVSNLAQLEQYEKQGYDVSEFKPAALALAQSRVDAKAVAEGRLDAASVTLDNPIDLDKLAPYLQTPRDVNSAFVQDAAGFVLLGKDKLLSSLAEAPLLYAAVVQANHALWKPGNFKATAVLVVAKDEAHCRDIPWLTRVANGISQLKNAAQVPADMEKLIKNLRVGGGYFCDKIGASLAGDADAFCGVADIKQTELPKTYIPSLKILPCLLLKDPNGTVFLKVKLAPAKYYQA